MKFTVLKLPRELLSILNFYADPALLFDDRTFKTIGFFINNVLANFFD